MVSNKILIHVLPLQVLNSSFHIHIYYLEIPMPNFITSYKILHYEIHGVIRIIKIPSLQ